MAETVLADIIEPAIFQQYVAERFVKISAFWRSGVVVQDPEFDARASGAGTTINMPYWDNLGGALQYLTDQSALTVNNVTAAQDVAVKHYLGNAWAANDLVKHIAGADPMVHVGNQVAQWWADAIQTDILLASLQGAFVAALDPEHVHDVAVEATGSQTAATKMSKDNIIAAVGKLGDRWSEITAIAMHSVPFQTLQSLDLIDFEHLSEQNIVITRFMGREVIVDDDLPVVAGTTSGFKYTSYCFGRGAFGHGEGVVQDNRAIELDRDSLAGHDILIQRRHMIVHPRGVAFTGTPAAASVTKTELELGTNWTKKWATKNIPIVKLVTN